MQELHILIPQIKPFKVFDIFKLFCIMKRLISQNNLEDPAFFCSFHNFYANK